MKAIKNFIQCLPFLIMLVIFTNCQPTYKGAAADLVIKNAKVFTVDKENPNAEALAFIGEEIIAVTTDKKIEQYIKEGVTKVIDAEGKLVIPGFNDAHAHFSAINLDYVELRYTTDPNIITEKVKAAVAKAQPGQLIRGGHWEHEMFTDKQWPTKELIDKVSPNNPVMLSRTDGHSVLVNSYVLKASGITKDTPDPFGGEIQKDPITGEPTGIFKESAKRLLKSGAIKIELSEEKKEAKLRAGWDAAFEYAASLGLTSIQHPGGGDAELYQRLFDEGKLKKYLLQAKK